MSAVARILCTVVANTTEFILVKHFRDLMQSAGLLNGFRYADNRAFLLSGVNVGNDWSPILLENVPGEEL